MQLSNASLNTLNTGLLCTCAQYLEVELLSGTECAFNIFMAVAKLSSKKAKRGPPFPYILAVNGYYTFPPNFAKLVYEKESFACFNFPDCY